MGGIDGASSAAITKKEAHQRTRLIDFPRKSFGLSRKRIEEEPG